MSNYHEKYCLKKLSSRWQFFSARFFTFFDINQQQSPAKDGLFRQQNLARFFASELQNNTAFDKLFCRMLLHFVEIYLKILLNYNSTIFFAKFRTQEAQESTNFDKFCTQNLSKFVELCWTEFDIIRLTPGYSTIFARSWNDC